MIKRDKDFEDMTIDEMLELYRNNKTVTNRLERTKDLLGECGLENTTLRERRELSGTEARLKERMEVNIKKTIRYLKQGLSQAEIAIELGVGVSHVRKLIDIIRTSEERRIAIEEAMSRGKHTPL